MSIPTRRSIPTVDGRLITDKLWGLYYKPDFNFGGVQGGASPYKVEQDPDEVAVDPYGPIRPISSSATTSSRCGARRWRIARSASRARCRIYKREENSGGIGCFTPDNFPVFDVFRENVYVIADSNHGYKMIGVGKLVAQEIVRREERAARAVPLLALRRGQASPGVEQPVPVELMERFSRTLRARLMEQRVKNGK